MGRRYRSQDTVRSWVVGVIAVALWAPWYSVAAPDSARINAGGWRYVDKSAQLWSKDFGSSSGKRSVSKIPVGGTRQDPLYASQRTASGSLRYEVPLESGEYKVTLHFAEMDPKVKRRGQRQFNVMLEGRTVIWKFDIFAQKGQYNAVSRSFTTKVSDGKLSVRLNSVKGNSVISAIEAVRTQASPAGNTSSSSSASVDLKLRWDAAAGEIHSYSVYFGRNRTSINRLASKVNVRWNRGLARNPRVTYNSSQDLGLRAGDPVCFHIVTHTRSGKSAPSDSVCTRI